MIAILLAIVALGMLSTGLTLCGMAFHGLFVRNQRRKGNKQI